MSPQPSSPPERQTAKLEPDRSSCRSDCMYIHQNTSNYYTHRGKKLVLFRPPDKSPLSAHTRLNWITDPPGCSTSTSGGTSPPVRGPSTGLRPPGWCGTASVDAVPIHNRVGPPDKGKCMHGLVGPSGITPNLILIQSNRKSRPFYKPSSWVDTKTWRSSGGESFYHFLFGGTNRHRNWFQQGCRNLPTITKVPK